MMPYDIYRLYQAERTKSAAEVQRAGEQAARIAAAVCWLFRARTWRSGPAADRGRAALP